MTDTYEPPDKQLTKNNQQIKVRELARQILQNTPGLMTMAEAVELAQRRLGHGGKEQSR